MDAQDFRSLQEAYMEVVSNQLDEVLDTPQKSQSYAAKNAASAVGAFFRGDRKTLSKRFEGAKRGMKKIEKRKEQKEDYDLYDIILSHLLDEGYAESIESAEVIMVNMSEDWREDIIEEMLGEGAAGDVAARAQKLANQRKGQTPERKKMYQDLANKALERERGPFQRGDTRTGMTPTERTSRRESDAYESDLYGEKKSTYGKGGITKNPRKFAQQKARGQHG